MGRVGGKDIKDGKEGKGKEKNGVGRKEEE